MQISPELDQIVGNVRTQQECHGACIMLNLFLVKIHLKARKGRNNRSLLRLLQVSFPCLKEHWR